MEKVVTLERICIHEAGHAVAHLILGWPLKAIIIRPGGPDTDGEFCCDGPDPEPPATWAEGLVIGFAGMAAERVILGGEPQCGGDEQTKDSDVEVIARQLAKLEVDPGTRAIVRAKACRASVELITHARPAVEAIGRQLAAQCGPAGLRVSRATAARWAEGAIDVTHGGLAYDWLVPLGTPLRDALDPYFALVQTITERPKA